METALDMNALHDIISRLFEEKEKLKSEFSSLEKENKELNGEYSSLVTENVALLEELDDLRLKTDWSDHCIELCGEENAELTKVLERTRRKLYEKEVAVWRLEGDIIALKEELSIKDAELTSLRVDVKTLLDEAICFRVLAQHLMDKK